MGALAVVIGFEQTAEDGENVADAKVDLGGGEILLAPHFGPAGYDAQPLPGDYAALISQSGGNGSAAIGYADPINPPQAAGGEAGFYARASDGAIVCSFYLRADGSARFENANGFFELASNGSVTINGNLRVDP